MWHNVRRMTPTVSTQSDRCPCQCSAYMMRRMTALMFARHTGQRWSVATVLAQLSQKRACPHGTSAKPSRGATRQTSPQSAGSSTHLLLLILIRPCSRVRRRRSRRSRRRRLLVVGVVAVAVSDRLKRYQDPKINGKRLQIAESSHFVGKLGSRTSLHRSSSDHSTALTLSTAEQWRRRQISIDRQRSG